MLMLVFLNNRFKKCLLAATIAPLGALARKSKAFSASSICGDFERL
jgi:hypothetical protein